MNVHDKAHELARALKESDEYKNFRSAYQVLIEDETAKMMVKDFMTKRMEIEELTFMGKQDKEKEEQSQKLYELIILNTKASSFINSHMRLMQTMSDIHKIISQSFEEIGEMDMFNEA